MAYNILFDPLFDLHRDYPANHPPASGYHESYTRSLIAPAQSSPNGAWQLERNSHSTLPPSHVGGNGPYSRHGAYEAFSTPYRDDARLYGPPPDRWSPQTQSSFSSGIQQTPSPIPSIPSWHTHQNPRSHMPSSIPTDMSRHHPSTRDRNTVDWEHADPRRVAHNRQLGNEPSQWPSDSAIQVAPFDSRTWDDMILSAMSTSSSGTYAPPHEMPLSTYATFESSPISSPSTSPSPTYDSAQQHRTSSSTSTPPTSRRGSVDRSTGKKCSHCNATSTPLWRREPTTLKPLCNACGLYLQQRNKVRPQELIDADLDDDDVQDADKNLTGPECSHCHTRQTSVWRRSKTGAQLCNACGVYSRLRGRDRPLSLKRNKIKPRSKHSPK